MGRARSFSGLTWVSGELGIVIREARDALEKYVEDDGDRSALASAIAHLSQVRGVLQMLHLSGAARLAEEMQASATAMLEAKVKAPQDAAEPLMLSLILLPDYIEKLETTDSEDLPSLLLDTINDLRRSRGASVLQESDLVLADLIQSMAAERLTEAASATLQAQARQIRPQLHKGLLTWLKGPNQIEGVKSLSNIFGELVQKAKEAPLLHGVLRAAQAITIGIIEGTIPENNQVKGLIGRVDRNIRELSEQGIQTAIKGILPEQFQDLLRLVARAQSNHPLINAVQVDYGLARIFPSETALAEGQRWLLAPSANALSGVRAAAIKELLPIKDTLDLFMRGGRVQIAQIQEQVKPVQRLANTLEMVGLGDLGKRLHARALDLQRIGSGEISAEDSLLMGIAADLLFVESSLDNARGDTKEWGDVGMPRGEMRNLVVRTLKEAAVDMAKAKEAIIAYIDSPTNMRSLETTPALFHGIAGALRVISHSEAANFLDQIRKFIQQTILTRNVTPDHILLEALAESIAAIEYYMEAVADGRSDVANILDIASAALQRLLAYGEPEDTTSNPTLTVTSSPLSPAFGDEDQDVTQDLAAVDTAAVPRELPQTAPTSPPMDPEILEIFLEEAREAEADIQQSFGRWRVDHTDTESLTACRRSFHTLKGSGRIAGAMEIGEFAWIVENLLNRVIDQTVAVSNAVLDFLAQAITDLPELIQAQEQNRKSKVSLVEFTRRADELLGKIPARGETSNTVTRPKVEPVATKQETLDSSSSEMNTASEMHPDDDIWVPSVFVDSELRKIFVLESQNHLSTLNSYIAGCEGKQAPYPLTEEVRTAFHTIAGSAHMAGVEAVAAIAKPIELKVKSLLKRELTADEQLLALIKECTHTINDMVAMLGHCSAIPIPKDLVDKIEAYNVQDLNAISTPIDFNFSRSKSTNQYEPETFAGLDADSTGTWEGLGDIWANEGIEDTVFPSSDLDHLQFTDTDTSDLTSKIDFSELDWNKDQQPDNPNEDSISLYPTAVEITAESDYSTPHDFDTFQISLPTQFTDSPTDSSLIIEEYETLEADQELREIFCKDAQDLLEQLDTNLQQWIKSPTDLSSFSQIKRTLYTLKGGARLAGIQSIGNLSHALEILLDSVTPELLPTNTEIQSLTQQTAERLLLQVDQVHNGGPVAQSLALIDELDRTRETLNDKNSYSQLSSIEIEDQITAPDSSVIALPELETTTLTPTIVEEYEDLGGDQELHEIFLEEAQELLEKLDAQLREWIASPQDPSFPSQIKRILHTLKGGARLAGVQPIGNLSHTLETLLDGVTPKLLQTHTGVLALAQRAADRLSTQVDQVQGGGPVAKSLALIEELEHTHAILKGKDSNKQPSLTTPKTETTATKPQTLPQQPKQVLATPVVEEYENLSGDQELLEVFLEEAQDLLEQLDARLREWVTSPEDPSFPSQIKRTLHTLKGGARLAGIQPIGNLSHTLETLLDGVTPELLNIHPPVLTLAQKAADRLSTQVDQVRTGGPVMRSHALLEELEHTHAMLMGKAITPPSSQIAPPVEAPKNQVIETDTTSSIKSTAPNLVVEEFEALQGDPELREIFLEEAHDLLEQLDNRLREWILSQDDPSFPSQIKRTLHTLKGGARLAGIKSIGDLSHNLETLLDGVTPALLKIHSGVLPLAQQAADRLAEQIDQVRRGGPVARSQAILEDLEHFHAVVTGQAQPTQTATPKSTDSPKAPPVTPELAIDPQPKKPAAASQQATEQVKVRADLLNRLISNASEISIYRARLEQHNTNLSFNLEELNQTVARLHEQLRHMTVETEAQIRFRKGDDERAEPEELEGHQKELDPLELDRFSTMQLLSRSLAETVNDLLSIRVLLEEQQKEAETLLLQHSRISNDLQDGLLRTRMVPFAQNVRRLHTIVRQTAETLNKKAELVVLGAEGEMDRNILDRIVAPLEHILRNAVGHGIELPAARRATGKNETGRITITLSREGNEVLINVADDGNGLNLPAIRKRALERGLLKPGVHMEDNDVMQLILEPGFSTSEQVTQISGRGVGTDVVVNEVKQLGGSLEISSKFGYGTTFLIHLPFTLAITQALLVKLEDDIFAVPHSTMEGVVRISPEELDRCISGTQPGFTYAGHTYPVRYLGILLGLSAVQPTGGRHSFPHLLVRSGDHRMAVQVDQIIGHSQIVMKSVGPQLSSVRWISGGTILVDGRVALILDVPALVRIDTIRTAKVETKVQAERPVLAMVVDDSITVRKATTRLLKRHNIDVITAKDGMDALAQLQEQQPDVMLLDFEMPRMDGSELARHMRNSPDARIKRIPIIMVTSRSGEKHREIGMSLGVKRYLGKPYVETDLLDNIYAVLAEAEAEAQE